jgi:plastocyanin
MKKNLPYLLKVAFVTFIFIASYGFNGYTVPVKHSVSIVNLTFSPSTLTINAGDTVEWAYAGEMSHNVNGTTATYPSNPASFGNSVGISWVYSFVFTIPGVYDYRCDVHYSSGMTGQITVLNNSGINGNLFNNKFVKNIFPNPALNYTAIELSDDVDITSGTLSVSVYNAIGRELKQISDIKSRIIRISTESLPAGLYFYQLKNRNKNVGSGKLIID